MTTRHWEYSRRRCLEFAWILAAITLPTFEARGSVLPEPDVRAAVETWVRSVTADARPDADVERMVPYVVGGETVAYVAELHGDGFCLAGADELMAPVTFYSPHGHYDPAHEGVRTILDEMARRLVEQRKQAKSTPTSLSARHDAERVGQWKALIAGQVPVS